MNEEVKAIVNNALEKGRRMRALQKEYFKSRSQAALAESKKAESSEPKTDERGFMDLPDDDSEDGIPFR